MSYITGKCDLYDHVYMIGSKGTTNSMSKKEMFEVFKRRTNGTIHQCIRVPVTKFNIDFLIKHNTYLNRTDHNTYILFNKEYKTLKQLNKAGVYYTRDIHFDTMLDLVPYLPYIIAMMTSDENGEYIVISEKSYIDSYYLECLEYGSDVTATYERNMSFLQNEYIKTLEDNN